ncbi:hypothetical protein BC937DRAFT_89814 [Endogone sp. FLAS-F59071]|nr:hypothetical protein BC937DRAFT_89814 [Endogone sp. FLAS-F59071]|eukprot:RUS17559.1 hypothetical protein BC937DRAFT_89814 [Endogone sp. FLAS-F59071]
MLKSPILSQVTYPRYFRPALHAMGIGKQTRGAERPTQRRPTPETNTSTEDLSDPGSQPPAPPSSSSKRPRSRASPSRRAATATSNSRSNSRSSKRKRGEPENDLGNAENREAIALKTARQRNTSSSSSGSKRKGRSGREVGQNEATNNDPDVSSDPEELSSRSKRLNTRPKRSTRGTRSAAKVNDNGSDASDGSSLPQILTASASSSKKQTKPTKTPTSKSRTVTKPSPSLTVSSTFSSYKGKGKPYTAEPAQQPPKGIGVKLSSYFPSNFEKDESSLSEATSEEQEEKIEERGYENMLVNGENERDIEIGYGDDMDEDEDDEEVDWEEVHVPVEAKSEGTSITTPTTYKDVHITFEAPKFQLSWILRFPFITPTLPTSSTRKPRGITKYDRQVRMLVHQTHLLCLLAHAAARNCWCNSPEIRAYAMSIVPGYVARLLDTGEDTEDVQASHRALIAGIKALVTWWKEKYFRITGRGIAMRSWSECVGVTEKMDVKQRAGEFSPSY